MFPYRPLTSLALSCVIAVPAYAATIDVNSAADVVNGADGQCTLREAILAANTNVASGAAAGECLSGDAAVADMIRFVDLPGSPDVYTLTIPPSGLNDAQTGDLNITERVLIEGNGQTKTIIEGGGRDRMFRDRIFRIEPGIQQVIISHVTIRNGVEQAGGGVANLGSTLWLLHVTIRDNEVGCTTGACLSLGGGLLNDGGTVTIEQSTITLNVASCNGFFCDAAGGGVANVRGGKVDFFGSIVRTNSARCASTHECTAEGGGIWSEWIVTLSQTVVQTMNLALCHGQPCTAQGGGIFVRDGGVATISDGSTVETNWTICFGRNCESRGGGLAGDDGHIRVIAGTVIDNRAFATCAMTAPCDARGGGIYSSGIVAQATGAFISGGSTVSNNQAACGQTPDGCTARGGGLYGDDGVAVVQSSTLSGNRARGELLSEGGGIYNHASLGLISSTLALNLADGPDHVKGGGVANPGTMNVWNSTFSTNVAQCDTTGCSSRGGAIFNGFTAEFSFATIFGLNTAGCTTSPCVLAGGGIYNGQGATISIKESIVSSSIVQDCFNDGGTFQAVGANLDGDGSCPGFSLGGVSPALLGTLAFNGGLTATHALASGSPAVDAASDCLALGLVPIERDQRGITRPKGAACDLGAYERTTFNLGASLTHVLDFLSDANQANDAAACGKLRVFLRELRAHERRGELTRDEVVRLGEGAERLLGSARCPGGSR